MNYIKHLTGFFDKVAKDRQLNPTHISLYIALFQFWNCNRFRNPISISRDEIMRISKISSKATYHKCLKALHNLGYIQYEPSYNPFKGSHVFLLNFADDLKPLTKNERISTPKFEPLTEQVVNKFSTGRKTSSEQACEQALVPSINNKNIKNATKIENALNGQAIQNDLKNRKLKYEDSLKKEKSSDKKEKLLFFDNSNGSSHETKTQPISASGHGGSSSVTFDDYNTYQTTTNQEKNFAEKEQSNLAGKPTINQVQFYFQGLQFPDLEAKKFFNYFESIGWLVGGKTAMSDWQAAARNWMLNAPKYSSHENSNRTINLNALSDKNYAEPL